MFALLNWLLGGNNEGLFFLLFLMFCPICQQNLPEKCISHKTAPPPLFCSITILELFQKAFNWLRIFNPPIAESQHSSCILLTIKAWVRSWHCSSSQPRNLLKVSYLSPKGLSKSSGVLQSSPVSSRIYLVTLTCWAYLHLRVFHFFSSCLGCPSPDTCRISFLVLQGLHQQNFLCLLCIIHIFTVALEPLSEFNF